MLRQHVSGAVALLTDAAFGRRLKENYAALGQLGIHKMFKDGCTTFWFEPDTEQVGQCNAAYADAKTRFQRDLDEVAAPEDVF